MNVTDLDTPCFLVDVEKVKSNCERMRRTCQRLKIQLRPHTKTHKTLEIAELQTNGSKCCIAVSTLAEAEFYAENGFDDILLAYPVTENKIRRCVKLAEKLTLFLVMISDVEGYNCLKRHTEDLPENRHWNVVVEVDGGYKRTGLLEDDAYSVAVRVSQDKRMRLQMLYSHCGDAYHANTGKERSKIQGRTADVLKTVQKRLSEGGVSCPTGTGSTPTCSLPDDLNSSLGEFHPGNYVFYDYQQYLLNACTQADIACRVMTRVVSHKPELHTLIVDCGFTALGHDGIHARHPGNFCLIEGESNLRLVGMSQEVGKVMAIEGELDCTKYPVGYVFNIIPYHGCASAAMHQKYYAHNGSKVVGVWTPVKGW